jgi:hypothetical protein
VNGNPDKPDDMPRAHVSPVRRALLVVVTIAYIVMAVWFAWSLVGTDSIPMAVEIASAVAAVVVVADGGIRLLRERRGRDRSE